jgi:hypothetical protein
MKVRARHHHIATAGQPSFCRLRLSTLLQLPRNTLLLEEELADLLLAHARPETQHPEGACLCRESPGGAAVYCRLGLPPDPDLATGGGSSDTFAASDALVNTTASATTGIAAGDAGDSLSGATPGTGSNSSSSSSSNSSEPAHHRLAVLIPYRDREKHLEVLLAELRPHLDRQQRAYDVFVVEQVCTLVHISNTRLPVIHTSCWVCFYGYQHAMHAHSLVNADQFGCV